MTTASIPIKPLAGWRVLVPRGGPWGDTVAAALRASGAVPVIAPMVNFAPTDHPDELNRALHDLQQGAFDWVSLTSATIVDVLHSQRVRIPATTRIAAVGETTAAAAAAVGYEVSLVPSQDNSASGMVRELAEREPEPRRFLTLRAEDAEPVLTRGLIDAGHDVQSVVAYRTVGEEVPARVVEDVASGRINGLLVTSGSVAAQVVAQFGTIPDTTLIAAIGPRTATDAARAGLSVHLVARHQTVTGLIEAVVAASQESGTPFGVHPR